MAIRVLDKKGNGDTGSVVEGVKWAVDHGAKVINKSLGTSNPVLDPALHVALEYAHRKGVTVVAAAGNDGGPVGSPANDPRCIAVSSTSNFWLFEWLSLFSNRGSKIEVAAPGGGIISTLPRAGSKWAHVRETVGNQHGSSLCLGRGGVDHRPAPRLGL